MSQDDQPAPTLAYSHAPADELLLDIRPIALILPSLAAVVVVFLPLTGNDPPIEPIANYARHFLSKSVRSDIWEAFITGPFLLAIPLTVWTIWLSFRPRAGRLARVIAWSMTATALAMTLLAAGYCATLVRRTHNFLWVLAAVATILAAGGWGVWRLRHLMRAYPPVLLAMTAVYCANTAMTILVVRQHNKWLPGSVLATIVVLAFIAATGLLLPRWSKGHL